MNKKFIMFLVLILVLPSVLAFSKCTKSYCENYPDSVIKVTNIGKEGAVVFNDEIVITPVIPKPTLEKGFEILPVSLTNSFYVEPNKASPELSQVHYLTDYVLSGEIDTIEYEINRKPDYYYCQPYYDIESFVKHKNLKYTDLKDYFKKFGTDELKRQYCVLEFETSKGRIAVDLSTVDAEGNTYDIQLTEKGFTKSGFLGQTNLKANDYAVSVGVLYILNGTYMNSTSWLDMWRTSSACTYYNTSLAYDNVSTFVSRCKLQINNSVRINITPSDANNNLITPIGFLGSTVEFHNDLTVGPAITYGRNCTFYFWGLHFISLLKGMNNRAMFSPIINLDTVKNSSFIFNNSILSTYGNASATLNIANGSFYNSHLSRVQLSSNNANYISYYDVIKDTQIIATQTNGNFKLNLVDGLIMDTQGTALETGGMIYGFLAGPSINAKNSVFRSKTIFASYLAGLYLNCTDCILDTMNSNTPNYVASGYVEINLFKTLNKPITSNGLDRVNYNVSIRGVSTNSFMEYFTNATMYNNIDYVGDRINGTYFYKLIYINDEYPLDFVYNATVQLNLTNNNSFNSVNNFYLNVSEKDIGPFVVSAFIPSSGGTSPAQPVQYISNQTGRGLDIMFIVILSFGLTLVSLGLFVREHTELVLIGFVILFLLGSSVITLGISYKTGENVTVSYTYINATLGQVNQTIITSEDIYSKVDATTGINKFFGIYLCILSVIGFSAVFYSLKRGRYQ